MQDRLGRAVDDALRWLLDSGATGCSGAGAVRAWFDPQTRRFSFAYPESAGYAITTLAYAYRHIDRNPSYLARACDCADWLLSEMYDEARGGFWCRSYDDHTRRTHICTFDNGMILTGLCNLYAVSRDRRYLETARAVHDLLVGRFRPNGVFLHRYLSDSDTYEPEQPGWSRQSGSFLAKAVTGQRFFRILASAPAEKVDRGADAFLDTVVRAQLPDGRFISDKFSGVTFLHPHCYTIEGLIAAHGYDPKPSYRHAVETGVRWLLGLQKPSGGFPHVVNDAIVDGHESADINAQVLRLWTMTSYLGWVPTSEPSYSRLIDCVLASQCDVPDPAIFGGFEYGYSMTNERVPHINSWATMFSLQALDYAKRALAGDFVFDPYLVV